MVLEKGSFPVRCQEASRHQATVARGRNQALSWFAPVAHPLRRLTRVLLEEVLKVGKTTGDMGHREETTMKAPVLPVSPVAKNSFGKYS